MSRFQSLLKPDSSSTPGEEQDRASRQLPKAVKASHLRWWTKQGDLPGKGKALLLLVAPFSHYDLALLDLLDAAFEGPKIPKQLLTIPIFVANLERYKSVEQLSEDIPAITEAPSQTPVAVVWEDGEPAESALGKHARCLAADTLGLSAEELNEAVAARVPGYRPHPRRGS